MADRPGVISISLEFDTNRFMRSQQQLHKDSLEAAKNIEQNFKNLGIKSDATFDMMRQKAELAFGAISKYAGASSADRIRAEQALAAQLKAISSEQTAFKIAQIEKENSANSAYWTARLTQEKAALQKSNQANADYWTAKSAFEKAALQKSQQENSDYWIKKIAFEKQAADQENRINSDYWTAKSAFEKAALQKSNQANADYWIARRAYEKQAMEQSAKQQAANSVEQNFKTLGIKSDATFDTMRKKAELAFEAIKKSSTTSCDDITRAQKALGEQYKAIQAEMTGVHEKSMASMVRGVLRLYAAYYVVSTVISSVTSAFERGLTMVDSYNKSVASLAAMVVTFGAAGRGNPLEQQWEKALKYSTAMVPVLEQIAAKTILSGVETTALANAFARQSVFLDATNEKQIEAFTRISNALPLMTQGQEIMRQINTEVRSLMTGQNEASSMLLTTLKALPGFSMELLDTWRAQGTVLEHLGELLYGFGGATKILENSWEAVKTTISTTATQVLRGVMFPIAEEIIGKVREMDKWLKDNKETISVGIYGAWVTVKNAMATVTAILSGFQPIAKDFLSITWQIAYGWGGIAAVAKPLGGEIGASIEKMIIAAKMLISYLKLGSNVAINPFAWAEGGMVDTELANIAKLQEAYEKAGAGEVGSAAERAAKSLEAYQKEIDGMRDASNKKVAIEDASLNTVESMRERAAKLQETKESAEWLKHSKNITIAKENELNAIQERLRAQEEYWRKESAQGKDAAEAWVKAESSRIQAEEKKASKTDNKDAINAAKEYSKALEDTAKEYERLTMAEDEFQKAQIWKEWENRADKATDAAKAVRDMQLAEVDLMRQEKLMAEDDASAKKILADLKTEENRVNAIVKAYDRLSKQLGLSNSYSEQFEAGQAKINAMFEEGKISVDQYTEALSALAAYENDTRAKAEMDLYEKTNGLRSDQFQKAYEETVKAEADILEVKMKALNQYFDKAAWIQAQLIKHAGESNIADAESIKTGLSSMENAFSSIQGMYEEGSDEYNKWAEAAKAMIVAQKALAVVQAVVAIATQGTGDPYTAFVRIAAMAATMGALLGSIGESVGGASSGSSNAGAAQGSSGVLGAEMGTGSESISNSIALLEETYNMEDVKLTRIYNELKQLNSNITSLVTSIVRTGGLGMAVETGTSMGLAQSTYDELASYAFGGALVGDEIASILTLGISDIFSSALGSIFGGSSSSVVQWTGLQIGDALVSELMKGVQISASQFATVRTETSSGLFGDTSVSVNTYYAALDQEVTDALTQVFVSMSDTLVYLAEGLGQDVNEVLNYVFEGTQIDLKGQTTEQMNATLDAYFSGLMDTAVNDLFGDLLRQYQKLDEGLMETAIRLIQDKAVVLNMLEMTNHAFEGTDEEAIALSETLITLAGSLTELTDAASTYYDSFTTDAAKAYDLQTQLTEAMAEMNLQLPYTREGYADILAALDITDPAMQETYVALLMMADAADQFYTTVESSEAALQDWEESYGAYIGQTSNMAASLKDLSDEFAKAEEAMNVLGYGPDQKQVYYDAYSAEQQKLIDNWYAGLEEYYTKAMGLNSDLVSSLEEVDAYYQEIYKDAMTLGLSPETMAQIYQSQIDIQTKMIDDWVAGVEDYYTTAMDQTSELGQSLDEIDKYFQGIIDDAEAMGSTDNSHIIQAEADVKEKAIADVDQAFADYYNNLMGYTTDLGQQIDEIKTKFEEYYKSSVDAGKSTEYLTAIMVEQDAAIQKIVNDWAKTLIQPFLDFGVSMLEWAQDISGMATEEIALSSLMIYRSLQGWSATGASDIFNIPTDNTDDIEAYVTELAKYYNAVVGALENTYDTLSQTKEAIEASIVDINLDGMDSTQQAAYYASQIASGYNSLSGLTAEEIPEALDKLHDDVMKYYDLEQQIIKDKHQTEIDAITEKNQAELQNIEAVRDKLRELTYSSFNLALPGKKATSASGDYDTLFAAAQTGDADAVSKYLSFVNTYLQSGQDAYKSSAKYQDMYAKAMADIKSLDTKPLVTIEDLTKTQNSLIAEQTTLMNSELQKLRTDTIQALNTINTQADTTMASVMAQLVTIFNAVTNLVNQIYGTNSPYNFGAESSTAVVENTRMTYEAMAAFAADPAAGSTTFAADGYYTLAEIMTTGFYGLATLLESQLTQLTSTAVAENTRMTYEAMAAFAADPAAGSTAFAADGYYTLAEIMTTGFYGLATLLASQLTQLTSIANNTYWIWVTNSDLNHAAGVPGYAEGGIVTSPTLGMIGEAGYPEAVIPMKNGFVPVRISGENGGYSDPETKALLKQLVAQGAQKQRVSIVLDNGRELSGYIRAEADVVRRSANERKGVERRRLYN